MTSPDQHDINERTVIQYLLGAASEEETERMDELSVADDDFAWRLSAIENDLVDAYVRGELSGDTVQQFQTAYLASPSRRAKVHFAEAFLTAAIEHTPTPVASPWRSWFLVPRLVLATASCLMLLAVAYLVRENSRLREQVARAQADFAALQRRQDSASTPSQAAPAKIAPPSRAPNLTAFLLAPPVRGSSALTVVALPPEADQATFRLQLESDDFPAYQASLKDLAANRIVWRSGRLNSALQQGLRTVSLTLPAELLKPRTYSLDLTGISSGGATEIIGSYAFRVAAR